MPVENLCLLPTLRSLNNKLTVDDLMAIYLPPRAGFDIAFPPDFISYYAFARLIIQYIGLSLHRPLSPNGFSRILLRRTQPPFGTIPFCHTVTFEGVVTFVTTLIDSVTYFRSLCTSTSKFMILGRRRLRLQQKSHSSLNIQLFEAILQDPLPWKPFQQVTAPLQPPLQFPNSQGWARGIC